MNSNGIDRRNFIVLSTAAVAGLASSNLVAATTPGGPTVWVGYMRAAARRRTAGAFNGGGISSAEAITVSEPSFIRTGARLAVRTFRRSASTPLSVTLDIHHHADSVAEKVPFQAWSHLTRGRDVLDSSPVSFVVPVEIDRTVDFAFKVRSAAGESARVISFTTGSVEGALKLNQGSYIFAISERAPDWNWLWLENGALRSAVDSTAPSLDYFVVDVSTPA